MPNHVTNIIAYSGDRKQIAEMLEKIKNDQYGLGTIDFNKIIPMPESLNIDAGSRTDRGLKQYKEFVSEYLFENRMKSVDLREIPQEAESAYFKQHPDIKDDEWQLGKTAALNVQLYGAPTWYEFTNGNWGTKWNAYSYEESEDYSQSDALCFRTAWCAPHPVIAKLAEMYPDVEFTHEWADEDIGRNCGRYTYQNGERMEEYFPESEVEAIAFAASVMDSDPNEWGLYLNAKGNRYLFLDDGDDYELIEILGEPALFTDSQITDADIPEGLFCYHLRDRDDRNGFGSLEKNVTVNHGGSIITAEKIDLGEKGYIPLDEETTPNFMGEQMPIRQFMEGDFEAKEGMTLG